MAAILTRMQEPSTYAGMAVLLGLFGVQVAPDMMQPVIQTLSGAAAVAAMVMRERAKK